MVDAGEQCDDGNNLTETECPYGGQICSACNADCSATLSLTGNFCGDGLVGGPEQCDDGNFVDGDGCSSTCTTEAADLCAVACPDDGNPCTAEEICDPSTGACSYPSAPDGQACDDETACTHSDQCSGGTCGGRVPYDCDDDIACTADSCDGSGGCTHVSLAGC